MHPAVLLRTGAVLALLTGALPVLAAEDPSDPAAPAAADRFRSTFSDYRPYAQAQRPAWREVLQEVAPGAGAEGGHAGHAGHGDQTGHEAPEPAEARDGHEGHPAADAPPPAPAPVDHSQHKHQ